jgi:hypothetical protein
MPGARPPDPMRSFEEIRFRLRQEAANLFLLFRPPEVDAPCKSPLALLPEPALVAARLKDTAYALEIEKLACGVLENRIPLLGQELSFTGPVPWRRDWKHDREFPGAPYFRSVPYLAFDRVGDHKFIWELNRHQYFVLLAQAGLITGRIEFFETFVKHWENWVRENPFQRGINWTSALEVAFRALSWSWVYHLAGNRMDEAFQRRFLQELYKHGCYIEYNLSVYFSPNTHLLGEGVALHALGALFPGFPRSADWCKTGSRIVREQLQRQVNQDGSHFEQSTYYHLYALDFFLLHYVLAGRPDEFNAPLIRMAEYLDAIQGPERRIPFIGDDDGGRLFHPYGAHDEFCRATLATCAVLFDRPQWVNATSDLHSQAAWWIGGNILDSPTVERPPHASRLFPGAGMVVFEGMASGGDTLFALAHAGGFGALRAGHSHSDALSIFVRRRGQDVLIDPGTCSYCDPRWRGWFRGSSAHNTLRIDHLDQAFPLGPFAWAGKPEVVIHDWTSTSDWNYLDATCSYNGQPFAHRRRILFLKDRGWILILDCAEGSGEHLVEQFWNTRCPISMLSSHAYQLGDLSRLLLDRTMDVATQETWRSPAYGAKEAAQQIVAHKTTVLPFTFAAAIVGVSDITQAVHVESGADVVIGDSVWTFPPRRKGP